MDIEPVLVKTDPVCTSQQDSELALQRHPPATEQPTREPPVVPNAPTSGNPRENVKVIVHMHTEMDGGSMVVMKHSASHGGILHENSQISGNYMKQRAPHGGNSHEKS